MRMRMLMIPLSCRWRLNRHSDCSSMVGVVINSWKPFEVITSL